MNSDLWSDFAELVLGKVLVLVVRGLYRLRERRQERLRIEPLSLSEHRR